MNILFIGDVFSSIGRDMIEEYLPRIKNKYNVDFVIAINVKPNKFVTLIFLFWKTISLEPTPGNALGLFKGTINRSASSI